MFNTQDMWTGVSSMSVLKATRCATVDLFATKLVKIPLIFKLHLQLWIVIFMIYTMLTFFIQSMKNTVFNMNVLQQTLKGIILTRT